MQKFLGNERSAQWVLALMLALAAANWPLLPEEVPIHWSSAEATPDSLGPKSFALLFLPVFALVLYLVLRIAPAFGSSDRITTLGEGQSAGGTRDDGEGGVDRYWTWARTLLALTLLIVYVDMLIAFRTSRPHPGAVIGLILVGVSPLLRSLEPNPLIGFRTPWAMRSDRCWVRTHRFAVLPTLVVGGALIALDVTDVGSGWPVFGGLLVGWAAVVVLYSYSSRGTTYRAVPLQRRSSQRDYPVSATTFRAPWSPALRLSTSVQALLLLAICVATLVLAALGSELRPWERLLALLMGVGLPLSVLGFAARFAVRGYTVSEDSILVHRLGWSLPVDARVSNPRSSRRTSCGGPRASSGTAGCSPIRADSETPGSGRTARSSRITPVPWCFGSRVERTGRCW